MSLWVLKTKSNFSVVMLYLVIFVVSILNSPLFSNGLETISENDYVTLGTTLSSKNGTFELGFFTPGKSSNYYIGIWYKRINPKAVVWVANRVTPIPSAEINSTRFRVLGRDLVIEGRDHKVIWSTNITVTITTTTSAPSHATLSEDANLMVWGHSNNSNNNNSNNNSSTVEVLIWQSFDHLTDTWIPGSRLGLNKRTGEKWVLTSWKSEDDPAPGLYTDDSDGNTGFLTWNDTEKYLVSGPRFGYPTVRPNQLGNITIVDNDDEVYITYTVLVPMLSRGVLDINGQLKQFNWPEGGNEWLQTHTTPPQQCDVYAYCGPFGICSENSDPVCDCLRGFHYKNQKEWNTKGFGCVRNANLKCGVSGDPDRFEVYDNVRPPRHPRNATASSRSGCESACLRDCSCVAYGYDEGSGLCSFWGEPLLHIKRVEVNDNVNGSTIYIRIAASEFSNVEDSSLLDRLFGKPKVIIPIIAAAVLVLFSCSICYLYYKRKKAVKVSVDEEADEEGDEDEKIDVEFFPLQSILEATNNFSNENKLGTGGFGPVYKGIFSEGQEIAIKRLSTQSRQGVKEFNNEVQLIAKLQHRNLVKLVGYCTQMGEKILLYEYMSNKSLDTFIFDQERRLLLDWNTRFGIILGIARGLVYLHHDSRLRIIHRDMKTNNILLDEEMTPKISDFGLARMVAGNTLQANTKKVVGTYGYLSPEYALSGLFSTKSDVFSFGVIILEIISGKKNTAFYRHEEVSNLIGYAWKLWNEGNPKDLLDDSLLECCSEYEVLKCINVGLLCVEEDPDCRPSMPSVLLMLADESTNLPRPYQPAFVTRSHTTNNESNTNHESNTPCSNQLTISEQEGR